MKKGKTKKAKGKYRKKEDLPSLGSAIDQLAGSVLDIEEEVERITKEGSPLEDIEGAKAQAAEVLEKYSALMKQLDPNQRKELQQYLKPGVDHIKHSLTHLKEAPE